MLLKNGQNIEQEISLSAVCDFVGPVFETAGEKSQTFEHTKINRGLKQIEQVFDVEVQWETHDLSLFRFQNLPW